MLGRTVKVNAFSTNLPYNTFAAKYVTEPPADSTEAYIADIGMLYNTTDNDKAVLAAVAVYTEYNRLADISYKVIKVNENEVVSGEKIKADINPDGKYTVKVFIWDYDNLQPLKTE